MVMTYSETMNDSESPTSINAAELWARIDALRPQGSAGAKFFRALYVQEGPQAVVDLMQRAMPLLIANKPITPQLFNKTEYRIYHYTWPQLVNRRHVIGGVTAMLGAAAAGVGGIEVVLDTTGAADVGDSKVARDAGGAKATDANGTIPIADRMHERVHAIAGPALVVSGAVSLAFGSHIFDTTKLHEVSKAITQMALLQQGQPSPAR